MPYHPDYRLHLYRSYCRCLVPLSNQQEYGAVQMEELQSFVHQFDRPYEHLQYQTHERQQGSMPLTHVDCLHLRLP